MALPSKDEFSILSRFKMRLADVLTEEQRNDDMFLLRWLRARDLDESAAEKMLRNAIVYRKENKLDELIIGSPKHEFFYTHFPKYLDGVDKVGRPVFCAPFGKWDMRKVINAGKAEQFPLFVCEMFEEINRKIKENSSLYPPKPGCPPVTQVVAIFEWSGFAWGQMFNYKAVQSLLKTVSIYEAHFPEILYTAYFVNCPSLISTVFTMIKPVMAPKTMAKIKVFGNDKNTWTEEILKLINADQVRPQFGGTKQSK